VLGNGNRASPGSTQIPGMRRQRATTQAELLAEREMRQDRQVWTDIPRCAASAAPEVSLPPRNPDHARSVARNFGEFLSDARLNDLLQ
jgi:hypothetical protein